MQSVYTILELRPQFFIKYGIIIMTNIKFDSDFCAFKAARNLYLRLFRHGLKSVYRNLHHAFQGTFIRIHFSGDAQTGEAA